MPVPNDASRSLIAWGGALALHVMAGAAVYLTCLTSLPAGPAADGGYGAAPLRLILSDAMTEAAPAPRGSSESVGSAMSPVVAPIAVAAYRPPAIRVAPPSDAAAGLVPAAADTASGAAAAAMQSRFLDLVATHIEQHRLPTAQMGHDGVVWLRILLQRDGRILRSWVDRGSGDAAIDTAGLAAVRRAEPLPAIPADLPETIDLTVPIVFGGQQ